MRADVIVVGAGTAGLPCAITAAERAARVLVLEKDREIGGTMHLSAGQMSAAGTRRQQARGIADSPVEHFEDVMRISRGLADPELVRLAVDEAPQTVDWLESLGFPFSPETPALYLGHDAYSTPRTYWSDRGNGPAGGMTQGQATAILETLRPLWDTLVANGSIVPLFECHATELVVENGTVTGVRALHGGELVELRADATVLATGGYGANPAFFSEVTPGHPRLVSNARPTSTGDGILMARRIGAHFRGAERQIYRMGIVETDPGSGRADRWDTYVDLSASARALDEIWVNERGRRFVAEDTPRVTDQEHAFLEQPGNRFWLVFDAAAVEQGSAPLPVGWDAATLARTADEGVYVWRADTLDELARRAGIHAAGLAATVRAYNHDLQRGLDPLGRERLVRPIVRAPFYALLTPGSVTVTFGGLAVDRRLRVLRDDGEPIPRLYAIGESIGAAATSGSSWCGGMLVTPALSFGRIVGRAVSEVAAPVG